VEDITKSADVLFADDTAIVHISGNKDSGGKIVKTNQGLFKVFGYTKTEIIGHFINILMPSIFAKRHAEFLEQFFKTGHKTVFNVERTFFGLHRNGCCICIVLMVKQMPTLEEGLQYVGMIRQVHIDSDFILTDTRGVIDSFSAGISSVLNLSSLLFKESEINVQILAPDLIKVFNSNDKKKTSFNKMQDGDGQLLSFIVPKEFSSQIQADNKRGGKDRNKLKSYADRNPFKKGLAPIYWSINNDLNRNNTMTNKQGLMQQLIQSHEYKEYEVKQKLKCEIQKFSYGNYYNNMKPLKIKVLKISGINLKKAKRSDSDLDGTYDDYSPTSNSVLDSSYMRIQGER
jgi:PAS domain S-box-containing protein